MFSVTLESIRQALVSLDPLCVHHATQVPSRLDQVLAAPCTANTATQELILQGLASRRLFSACCVDLEHIRLDLA